MQGTGEQNVHVRRIVVFYVMDNFESILDGRADAELGLHTDWRVELLPDLLVEDAAVELRVLQGAVEVFYKTSIITRGLRDFSSLNSPFFPLSLFDVEMLVAKQT